MKRGIKLSILLGSMALLLSACGSGTSEGVAVETSIVSAETGGASDKVPDPNAPIYTIVSVYVPKSDGTGLKQKMESLDSETLDANLLWEKLIEYGVVAEDATLLSFTKDGDSAILDVSELEEEAQILTSVGNTFTENFELTSLDIQVNGSVIRSGYTFITDYASIQ